MSLIERLCRGMEANPSSVDSVIREALLSDFDMESAFAEYQTAEYALSSLFKVLTSKRAVSQSTFNTFKVQHVKQYDLYEPVSLTNDNAQLVCYPLRIYDEAQAIDGKKDELKEGMVQAVTGYSTAHGYPVRNKWYGYLFIAAPLDVSQGEGNLPTALEEVKADFATLTRTEPNEWLTSFRVNQGMLEDQAAFKQFTEELLVHEGHKQVPTWQ